jgi:hypothetical protein
MIDTELDVMRAGAGPLRLTTDLKANRAGFRLWHDLLLLTAAEEEDCYRIGRVGLREMRFDKTGLRKELWVDQIPHTAVQINEPTDPASENGLSAIARDAKGRRFLLRQAWLQANKASPAVRDQVFASLTKLPIADVHLGRVRAKRQWHVVTPLDKVSPDLVARATADFVERCWQARDAIAGGLDRDESHLADLIGADRAGVARLISRITRPDVAAALRFLIETAAASGLRFVFRKSTAVAGVEFQDGSRRNLYSLIANSNHLLFYLRAPAQQRAPRLSAQAVARYGDQVPNSRGEYRITLGTLAEAQQLVAWLRDVDAWERIITPTAAVRRREPAVIFDAVTAEHLLAAARRLADGFTDHPFGASTDYDLLFEGSRLPPKAVFGLAATVALGRPIGPGDFSGGLDTPCFRILAGAGYVILAKNEACPAESDLSVEDRIWAEGDPKLVTHLKRERSSGLSAAKRAQFIASHGKLFCERCEMDPVTQFGQHGEACIEVHHDRVAVADMAQDHRTELDDLQCLCANCHRVVHRELKIEGARA